MALNPKQKAFAKHYAASKNATEAAKLAGYSKKTAGSQGHDLLKNPEIKKAINADLSKLAKKADITGERVVKRIAEFAFDKKHLRASDTLRACELLGKHFKLFTDVQELSGKDGEPLVLLTMPANGSEGSEPNEGGQ